MWQEQGLENSGFNGELFSGFWLVQHHPIHYTRRNGIHTTGFLSDTWWFYFAYVVENMLLLRNSDNAIALKLTIRF